MRQQFIKPLINFTRTHFNKPSISISHIKHSSYSCRFLKQKVDIFFQTPRLYLYNDKPFRMTTHPLCMAPQFASMGSHQAKLIDRTLHKPRNKPRPFKYRNNEGPTMSPSRQATKGRQGWPATTLDGKEEVESGRAAKNRRLATKSNRVYPNRKYQTTNPNGLPQATQPHPPTYQPPTKKKWPSKSAN